MADNSSPEGLAKTLLHIIKKGDQELFDKHLMTPYEQIYSDTVNSEGWYESATEYYESMEKNIDRYQWSYSEFEGGKDAWLAQYHPDTILAEKIVKANKDIIDKSKFAFILKDKFRERGLSDWSNVEFENFSFQFKRDGQVTNNNKLTFRNGDYRGVIRMPAFIKAPDGTWRFHNIPRFDRYGYVPRGIPTN